MMKSEKRPMEEKGWQAAPPLCDRTEGIKGASPSLRDQVVNILTQTLLNEDWWL